MTNPDPTDAGENPVRTRILDAAFSAFVAHGYAQASTLEIATRAGVSKRELYALVGKKQDMLVACITERAARMRMPADLPAPADRETLARVLAAFGAHLLRAVSDPTVTAMFRLAIAEADRTPEIARALESIARAGNRAAVTAMLAQARAAGLVDGDPAEMAGRFTALLWGNLMIDLLLRVADQPPPTETDRRARDAASALLRLYPKPDEGGRV